MEPQYIQELNQYYNNKYRQHGNCVKSLGWSSEGQAIRFNVIANLAELDHQSVLDVGSGLGHFAMYLRGRYPAVVYKGYDINENFVEEARATVNEAFELRNILTAPPTERFDFVYSIGALNSNFSNNEEVMKEFIRVLFQCCSKSAAVSMTSIYVDEEFRDDETMYYYNPCEIFTYAKSLTKWVSLFHDYLPHDFTIVMHRRN